MLALLGGGFVLAVLPALAQPPRMPRIGYLLFSSPVEPPSPERQAFLDGLRERGYVPGKSVEIIYRSAQNEQVFLDDMCQELLQQKVDVIVASGALAILAAKKATRSVPIVMQAVGDPVGIGAVRSLARPEANVTGVSFLSTELAGKRIELLREIAPGTKRIAVLWDARNANAVAESSATLGAAKRLAIATVTLAIHAEADLPKALDQARASRADALYVTFEGGLVAGSRTYIADYALRQRMPIVSGWSRITEAGGLLSYAPSIPAMFRRSASYVDRVLKGAKPSELPVEQASTVELVINAKTAKAIGIQLPPSILVRADRVIE